MSIFKRMFSPIDEKHQRSYVFFYTVCFLIFCISCFFLFAFFKKSFVWQQDGWDQHLRALIYYHRYLKDIFANLFIHHTFSLPTYSTHIGLGSDLIQTLHYYVIGDPLTLLSVFVKEKYMYLLYCFLVILRLYLAGAAFSLYGYYMARRSNTLKQTKITGLAILMGSMIYCFNGYVFYGGTRHPYFINPMIYLPLVYLGVEKILNDERPYLFIFAVGLSAISSFYFFYMIVILTVIYVVIRLFAKDFKKVKAFFIHLGKIFLSALIGTGFSMIILLPQLFAILGSSRMSSQVQSNFLPNLKAFETTFGAFFTADVYGENWTAIGIAMIALIVIILLFLRKGYRSIKVAFVLMSVMLLSPKISQFMNGNSYPSNRWGFGYLFLLAMAFVYGFEYLFSLKRKDNKVLIIVLGILAMILFVNEKTRLFGIAFAFFLAFMMLFLLNTFHHKKKLMIVMLTLVLINASVNAFLLYTPFGNRQYLTEMLDDDYVKDNVKNNETKALDQLGDQSFFRYEATRTYAERPGNHSLLSKYSSNQYYWSLENGNLSQYRNENGVSENPLLYCFTGFNKRTILSTLNSVKYLFGRDGYDDYKKIGKIHVRSGMTYPINQNQYALPLGYTYDRVLSTKNYEKLSAEQKQEAMMQAVVLDTTQSDFTPKTTSYSCPFKITKMDGVTKKGNTFITKKKDATITIAYKAKKESAETYLKLVNAKYQKLSARQCYSKKAYQNLSELEKIQIRMSDLHASVKASTDVITSLYKGKTCLGGSLNHLTNTYDDYYHFIKERLINNAITKGGKETMTIRFKNPGIYTTSGIEVIKQPLKLYETEVKKIGKETLQNVDFHESKYARATSSMTGTIDVSKTKYLLLTIPYSKGWTAYVDGQKAKLMKANTVYSCLKLSKGHHEINMVYHTPGMKIGGMISLGCLILFVGIVILNEKKRRKIKA